MTTDNLLLITGTGRCGTSLLAEFCRRCGYDPGGGWSERRNAGREHPAVVAVNESLVRMLDRGEPIDLDHCAETVRSLEHRVVKDPRFLWDRRLLSYWQRWRPRLRVILLCRRFEAVSASAARCLEPRHRRTAEGYRRSFAEFVLALADGEVPFRVLPFPSVLSRYDRVHTALTGFGGLDIDRRWGESVWKGLVAWEKVHRFTDSDQSPLGRQP